MSFRARFVCLLTVCFLAVQIVAGQAPGDEDDLCTVTLPSLGQNVFNDPPNVRLLMDSSHYEYLLPPNTNPVWQRLNLDSNNGGGGTTKWTEHGGQCTSRVIACGYEQGPQDNWLITQHINRNVDGALLPQVTVRFEYQQSCPTDSTACQRAFDVFVYERSTIDPIAARNSSNFVLITRLSTPSQTQALIVDINFNTQESGFYLAIRDQGTCIIFSRVLVFYYVCPAETVYLVERPETISPALQVTASCVDGASPVDGDVVTATCTQQGLWLALNASCKCNRGSVLSSNHTECIKCEAGFYASASLSMCLLCPNNSKSTQPGMTECACDDGYYRTKGEVDQPCTLASSLGAIAPTVAVITTTTVIALITAIAVVVTCIVYFRKKRQTLTVLQQSNSVLEQQPNQIQMSDGTSGFQNLFVSKIISL